MNIKALLESKIREYDASIDLTEGSRIQRTVIAPVVSSLSLDPLSVSTRDYLYARFSEAFPDSPITRGNALDDILITATEYFLDGYRAELASLKNATSLNNLDLLSDDEADALASNWFVTRDEGARATGSVTVVVDRPSSISINTSSVRFFAGGNEYVPTVNTLITTDALLANSIGSSLYEFTINVQANAVGPEFNAAVGNVSRVTGINNVVSVNNKAPILGGLGRDTTEYLLSNKLPRAISERSLVTARGIGARIATDVPGILRYQVIGHGETEMLRDRVDVRSFADLIASGHIYYMSSFALIAAYPHKASSLSKGDYLQTIGSVGAPDSRNIARVISTLNVSVLSNNPLGFTTLVELEEPPPEGVVADSVSILRPGSVLLGETVVDSDIGLGGRADIYIKGDSEQQIVGTSTLDLDGNSYRGLGWSMEGNLVTIELPAPIEENQLTRYQHIILNGTAYTISSIELAPNDPRAFISVYNTDVSDSGADYFIVDDLVYRTGADYKIVSPSNGSNARLSCIIGSSTAQLLDIDLVTDGVRQGDIIDIPSLGIRRAIFSVDSNVSLSVDTVFQQTLSDVGARVIRFVSRVISPIIEFDVPSVPPQHPISVDVDAIRAEIGEVHSGTGNILLPLGEAISTKMMETGVQTVFADIYNTLDYLRILAVGESTTGPNRLAPASRGYLHETPDDLGICNVLVAEPIESTPNAHVQNGLYEMRMWCDLFTRNSNNIFVLRGDTRTSAKILDFPGSDVNRGDILRISNGYLAGDYVIESVLHNVLKREGKAPTAVTRPGFVNVLAGEYTYSDITDPDLSDEIWYQKVTFVRIYGEFPKNPMAALAAQLAVTLQQRYTDQRVAAESGYPEDDWTFGSISSSFINAYVNGSEDMFEPTTSSEILDAFKDALSNAVLPPQVSNDVVDITSLFERGLTANYEIIRPSQSVGHVRMRHRDDVTVLARPSAPLVDVDNLIGELYMGTVRTITYKHHTVITGSTGTYHLSPHERYYIDGADYRSWPSDIPPHIYDSRIAQPSYTDTFAPDYVLFESLIEFSAGGVLPLRIQGPSSITSPFMRNDGTRLIRYPELALANNALTFNAEQTSSVLFYFAAPIFPEASDGHMCSVALVGVDDSEPEFYLYYIPSTSPEFDQLIDSLGNAVDGTGTLLSTIYRQHNALFKIEIDPALRARAVEYLVGLYGQIVVANFWEFAGRHEFVSDEFLMESLLPYQGSTYSLPELGCVPTSVATVSQRADRMEVVPSTELSTLEADLVGTRLRIEYRDEVYWRRVSATEGKYIFLNEPLPFGTPTCVASGLCILDLDTNVASLISDPIFYGGEEAISEWDEEYTTHLNTGGATRALSDADVGRHITFWGYRSNELDYRSVLLNASLPEFDSFDSWAGSMMRAERETFGQFEITDVSTTFSPVSEGAETVPKRIDISIAGAVSSEAPRIGALEATKILCAFAVTDSVISLEDGIVNSVAKVNVFAQAPYEYRFVGVSKNSPDQYLAQPLFGSKPHEYVPISNTTPLGEDVSTFVLTQDHSLEPTTIETDHLVVLSEDTDLVIRTTNAQSYTAAQSMHASGERAFGYTVSPVDLGTSKSIDEDLEIRIPCVPGTVSDTLTVQGYFDPTIGQAQSVVDATNERPVCADLLVKTLHQAYIGLEVSYVGGPSQEEVKKALTQFIKSRVLAEATITRSKIVSLIMNMGAATVNEPIDLYVCLEDNSRRIHKRTIIDEFSEGTLFKTDTTLRTLYPSIAVDERLGASIIVSRITQQTNTVGNGGS